MGIAITLEEYLDNQHVDYELIQHKHSGSSSETAEFGHIPGDQLAKAVLLEDSFGDYIVVVVPSTHRVDLGTLHRELNMRLGLATESNLPHIFDDCEPGAVPAVGQAYGLPVLVDESLDAQKNIYFESGSHTDVVHMDGGDFTHLMDNAKHGFFSHHV